MDVLSWDDDGYQIEQTQFVKLSSSTQLKTSIFLQEKTKKNIELFFF